MLILIEALHNRLPHLCIYCYVVHVHVKLRRSKAIPIISRKIRFFYFDSAEYVKRALVWRYQPRFQISRQSSKNYQKCRLCHKESAQIYTFEHDFSKRENKG